MRKSLIALIVVGFLGGGCATTVEVKETVPAITTDKVEKVVKEKEEEAIIQKPDSSPELVNVDEEQLEEYVEKKGIIFAKTDFQGVLKTRYVRLFFENLTDPEKKFQLHIGEKTVEQTFPWEVKNVEPGYFFIELPQGQYKISSIAIPVGTTTAEEEAHISFNVAEDTITYIGTLKIVGTKEKIKLGGVPVIKPGFEYTIEVLDQREEGITEFRNRYPNIVNEVNIELMELKAQQASDDSQ